MQGMRVKNHKNHFNQNWSSVRSKGGTNGSAGYPAFWEKTAKSNTSPSATSKLLKFPSTKTKSKTTTASKSKRPKKAA